MSRPPRPARQPGPGLTANTAKVRRDPFADLGMDARRGLTDDEVRAAWRRIAAATHPDRADGGDPDRYAAAAAAYTELRTGYGRGEALAALAAPAGPAGPASTCGNIGWHPRDARGVRSFSRALAGLAGLAGRALSRLGLRVARGRPGRLALRAAAAVAVAWAALAAGAAHGAGPAVVAGAATWLILTGRQDLAP